MKNILLVSDSPRVLLGSIERLLNISKENVTVLSLEEAEELDNYCDVKADTVVINKRHMGLALYQIAPCLQAKVLCPDSTVTNWGVAVRGFNVVKATLIRL